MVATARHAQGARNGVAVALWLLLAALPPAVFSGRLPPWTLLFEFLVFGTFAVTVAGSRPRQRGSQAVRVATLGTSATAIGSAISLVSADEYGVFFILVGGLPLCGLWLIFFLLTAVLERYAR